ncbi:type 2 isopentenyl-diphosphate Delta-isomerase [Desertibacillus haloalkaliphilus]|uniref:type 2 isopentenyl-diphosphate Delta-isomerase n=1 Tax=Desertibacillus haloalkaliphilus TaxID=1328930 RepID=UPI001C252B78|nr:type 2 isopentenyl-diphosphate Delta-isomerase [Desertibacillus haloalkaliphilus]MBU8907226.1 type 2 isopentenyl-diphosphate Delta-isomerase [Desertibacillus haloalkaliphilus]
MSRAERKIDHIKHAIATGQDRSHGFEDIQFVHQSLPNSSVDEIKLATKIGELPLSSPIFINAMTGGGGAKTLEINQQLATVASECKLGIAVGSQMAALRETEQKKSYEIIRKVNPNGVVIGNLGSEATLDQAKRAVDMLEANGLQIHLNTIQELVMPEGDRSFIGALNRIENIKTHLDVPVVVKEVGFGMSKETAKRLADVGVTTVDVGGVGGTNFAKIENNRRDRMLDYFNHWGITTTASICEVKRTYPHLSVIGSGGIQSALEVAKAVALGASAVGIAGHFLKILMEQGIDDLLIAVKELEAHLRFIMTALGAQTIQDLQHVPLVLKGETHHWLEQRGVDTTTYSTRS